MRVRPLQRPRVLRSDAPFCSCLASLPFGLRDLTPHRSLGMRASTTKRPCGTFVPETRHRGPVACPGVVSGHRRRAGRPVRPLLAGCAPSGAGRPARHRSSVPELRGVPVPCRVPLGDQQLRHRPCSQNHMVTGCSDTEPHLARLRRTGDAARDPGSRPALPNHVAISGKARPPGAGGVSGYA